jgi:hypothetical protein
VQAVLRELVTKRHRVIGRFGPRTVKSGSSVRARFPITRAGLRLLARRSRVRVRVEVTSRHRDGTTATATRRFTLHF